CHADLEQHEQDEGRYRQLHGIGELGLERHAARAPAESRACHRAASTAESLSATRPWVNSPVSIQQGDGIGEAHAPTESAAVVQAQAEARVLPAPFSTALDQHRCVLRLLPFAALRVALRMR